MGLYLETVRLTSRRAQLEKERDHAERLADILLACADPRYFAWRARAKALNHELELIRFRLVNLAIDAA